MLILVAITCVARLGYWQVVARDRLLEAGAAQMRATVTNEPIRGTITDRTGAVVLATTVLRHRLVTQATALSPADRIATGDSLTSLLALNAQSATRLRATLDSGRKWAVLLPALDAIRPDERARGETALAARLAFIEQVHPFALLALAHSLALRDDYGVLGLGEQPNVGHQKGISSGFVSSEGIFS